MVPLENEQLLEYTMRTCVLESVVTKWYFFFQLNHGMFGSYLELFVKEYY